MPDDPMYDEAEQRDDSQEREATIADVLEQKEAKFQRVWNEAMQATPSSVKRSVGEARVLSAVEVLSAAGQHVEGYEFSMDLTRPEEDGDDD